MEGADACSRHLRYEVQVAHARYTFTAMPACGLLGTAWPHVYCGMLVRYREAPERKKRRKKKKKGNHARLERASGRTARVKGRAKWRGREREREISRGLFGEGRFPEIGVGYLLTIRLIQSQVTRGSRDLRCFPDRKILVCFDPNMTSQASHLQYIGPNG